MAEQITAEGLRVAGFFFVFIFFCFFVVIAFGGFI